MTAPLIRAKAGGAGHDRIALPDTAEPEIVLDISRLLSRILHQTPTGVDRVEMAYADMLTRLVPHRLSFGAVHPSGRYGRIPNDVARRFLDRVKAGWSGERVIARSGPAAWADLAGTLWTMRPRAVPRSRSRRVFLQSSPHHLHREPLVRSILRRENALFACLLHDLIPIDYPEYARPGGNVLHERRIRTVARLADVAIANSAATRQSFLPHLTRAGRAIDVHVAHLGLKDREPSAPAAAGGRPYFLCLGTIEPRKNHLLLLNIWRALARDHDPADVPKLILVGRRGWENEQVIDMLERCPALRDTVEERSGLPDAEVQALIAGARALLMPSFAEGYGMPVTEALALGVPVLCSDLPALREAGGKAPDYIDPLDGKAWRAAILDYSTPCSIGRERQAARIAGWTAPSWTGHIGIVLNAIGETTR